MERVREARVDRAFGLPGRRELDALARSRDQLFALEGRERDKERSSDMSRALEPEVGRRYRANAFK